jgi:hypothetical protein
MLSRLCCTSVLCVVHPHEVGADDRVSVEEQSLYGRVAAQLGNNNIHESYKSINKYTISVQMIQL